MSDPPSNSDRLNALLAEYNALRAELLAHSNNQTTFVGLGTTTVGVAVGLAISQPAGRALFVLVPVLSIVVVLAYSGLAYRIICIGEYVGRKLWPEIQSTAGITDPGLSWEVWLAALERLKWKDRLRSNIVEYPLLFLLLVIGFVAALSAGGAFEWIGRIEAGAVVVAAIAAIFLCRRGRVPVDQGSGRSVPATTSVPSGRGDGTAEGEDHE